MAQPVWTLSVDLVTKTATFQTGMADAAKSARASFGEIRDSAKEMGEGVSEAARDTDYSMTEARHGVMMLGEEFGVHLPRGLTTFIASLGPVGAAMEAAFPFLAIILGATLLIEHIVKMGEAAEKAAEAGKKLDDEMTVGVDKAKEALIDAEIEADKLAGKIVPIGLLSERLELEGAIKGIHNLDELGKKLEELVKAHGSTSNWNPFNWLDHSDDLQNRIKSLKESLTGKSDTEQMGILDATLANQSKVLEGMRARGDASKTELSNEIALLGWLKQQTDEMHTQKAAEEQQGKNKKTEQDQTAAKDAARELEAWEKTYYGRYKAFQDYITKAKELRVKDADDAEKEAELERAATASVLKTVAEEGKERAHIAEEMGKAEADRIKKMAALDAQDRQAQAKEEVKLKRSHSQEILDEQIAAEQAQYDAQMHAAQVELSTLDKSGKDYEVKLKQINDKEEELTRAHESKIRQIKAQAEDESNAHILAARKRADDMLTSSMMGVLSGHETAGKALIGIGNQVAAGMMENALKSVLANDFTKESDAAAAARKAYLAGMHFPFPVNIVMGPLLGAMAFASVMAFEGGGIVPGVEKGDVVPARLTPGEGVMPKKLTEGLTRAAESGSMNGSGDTVHFHYSPTQHFQSLDSSGMQNVLDKHADVIEQHVNNAFRKRNM